MRIHETDYPIAQSDLWKLHYTWHCWFWQINLSKSGPIYLGKYMDGMALCFCEKDFAKSVDFGAFKFHGSICNVPKLSLDVILFFEPIPPPKWCPYCINFRWICLKLFCFSYSSHRTLNWKNSWKLYRNSWALYLSCLFVYHNKFSKTKGLFNLHRSGMKILQNLLRHGQPPAFGIMDLRICWDFWVKIYLYELEGRKQINNEISK